MEEKNILSFLDILEKLKCNTRHCWTSSGRNESVAEHSWRLAVFAYLVKDKIPKSDINKLILMCLIHDWGEAITGDIPTFKKTSQDRQVENEAVMELLQILEEDQRKELKKLFEELNNQTTIEAKVCNALDKLEGVLQHNEADIKTWLPLEYKLQLIHGEKEVMFSEYLIKLRNLLREESEIKIKSYLGEKI